ncbi:hypothetical protein K469DRAFT_541438, partial [Zopfia rhizophila CBS 207.26]
YKAIQDKHKATVDPLLLWSFLDNRDLWYGLFTAVRDIASNELEFSRAMQLLRNYSLIEDVEELASYATHPVVHRWVYHYQWQISGIDAVPNRSARDYSTMQRRLHPHAQACSRWVLGAQIERSSRGHSGYDVEFNEGGEEEVILHAIHLLSLLYADQGKLGDAEKMYERALRGYEEAL